ncbi:RNA polymerase, sigma 27/28 subunit, RpsK/SigK [Virgibacillus pantothenticus]|nr:RNA polymerase, sigma 27/28 subunit, RpsK/SigK [Virgibacillus pantothenticus]
MLIKASLSKSNHMNLTELTSDRHFIPLIHIELTYGLLTIVYIKEEINLSGILSALALLIKEAMFFVSYVKNHAFPQPLPPDEEKKYIQQMQDGSETARNKLIEHNLRLVAHIVKKFENTGEDAEDLISIGTIGLIKGVESYSSGKGTKLATYAARCIENEILMHLRALKKVKKDVSLHDPIGQDKEGNEISLIDILEAENQNIIEFIQLNMEIEKMEDYFAILDKREREVIVYRYGLNDEKELTQREIAKKLNISRSYVSRIEKRALMKVFHEYYRKEHRK